MPRKISPAIGFTLADGTSASAGIDVVLGMNYGWVVKHTNGAVDGLGLSWTKEQAEDHVRRCEYVEHGIPFEILKAG